MQSAKPPENAPQSDPNLENMYMLLDPHLRPATPDLQDSYSRALFEEHKKLAQEYLKVGIQSLYVQLILNPVCE